MRVCLRTSFAQGTLISILLFCKRAPYQCRALLRKETSQDKASCASSAPCIAPPRVCLHTSFSKRATNYRAVLRKETYQDEASCESSARCIAPLRICLLTSFAQEPLYVGLFCKWDPYQYRALLQKRLFISVLLFCKRDPFQCRALLQMRPLSINVGLFWKRDPY